MCFLTEMWYILCSDVPLRDMLWMGALKAGSRMRWMDMLTADEAHVDPAALLVIRTEADVRALLPLVRLQREAFWIGGGAHISHLTYNISCLMLLIRYHISFPYHIPGIIPYTLYHISDLIPSYRILNYTWYNDEIPHMVISYRA